MCGVGLGGSVEGRKGVLAGARMVQGRAR
jgi:hypothetical protein